jgi:hypothetical protein
MTKKDYELVAKAIASCLSSLDSPRDRGTLAFIVTKLSIYFEDDNSKFDREKFQDACGLGDFF